MKIAFVVWDGCIHHSIQAFSFGKSRIIRLACLLNSPIPRTDSRPRACTLNAATLLGNEEKNGMSKLMLVWCTRCISQDFKTCANVKALASLDVTITSGFVVIYDICQFPYLIMSLCGFFSFYDSMSFCYVFFFLGFRNHIFLALQMINAYFGSSISWVVCKSQKKKKKKLLSGVTYSIVTWWINTDTFCLQCCIRTCCEFLHVSRTIPVTYNFHS